MADPIMSFPPSLAPLTSSSTQLMRLKTSVAHRASQSWYSRVTSAREGSGIEVEIS